MAITDSLLLARYEREQLIPTIRRVDTHSNRRRLAWLAGDLETWASLLDTLAKDNSEAVDFVLQEDQASRSGRGVDTRRAAAVSVHVKTKPDRAPR